MPETNVKTNSMASTKWTYHKDRSFASNYFCPFENFVFGLRTAYKELTQCTNDPNVHIHTFWQCFFPVSILKIYLKRF